jgi:hypothetical protein
MSNSAAIPMAKTPESQLLDAVLNDFNSHEAVRFTSHFALDAIAYQHPGIITQNGQAEMIAYYLQRFEEVPKIHAELLHRIVIGDYVIDHESIRRSPELAPVEVLAINFVNAGKIQRLDVIRETSPVSSSPNTQIVDALVDAYNKHDAQQFAACFAEDANAYEHPGTIAQKGRNGIEAHYARRFADLPELTTQVLHRITLGDYVIDHERVQRASTQRPFETLAINLVREGKIRRLDIVR